MWEFNWGVFWAILAALWVYATARKAVRRLGGYEAVFLVVQFVLLAGFFVFLVLMVFIPHLREAVVSFFHSL